MTCNKLRFVVILGSTLVSLMLSSCYSFRSSVIDQAVSTFYVGQFKIAAYNAPATINQTFGEALKDKIARESRLKYTNGDADIEFEGTIQSFIVAPIAPQPNEQTAFNRLTISVNVEYTNHKNEKDHWTKTFSHFADFATDQNLLQVQDDLIKIIFDQVLEDVFNQAFNNW
jgi:hypothetical protein